MAGRTDAGVHARGQVASHEGEPAPRRELNGVLPDDVSVLASEVAARGLRRAPGRAHAAPIATACSPARRRSPFERTRALWWPRPIDRADARSLRRRSCPAPATSPPSPRPTPSTCGSSAVSSRGVDPGGGGPARLLDRGGQLHATHGARVGRDDARRRRPPDGFERLLRGAPRRGGAHGAGPRPLPGVGLLLNILGFSA